ncbi:MAG: transcription factor S [Nanoarchaeota archaeon]|nr:transcription factor S [Nanoarchaeota archaeon]MBU1501724.1 transcription factor S [Nanoarchaeota archaeon]MBU2459252.1 transcription factor S [Nanoarchaeota archaeon]
MEFCPKCGAVLIQKKNKDGCPRCRYTAKGKVRVKISEKVGEKKKINIVSDKDSEVHPVIELEKPCVKCSNKKAYFWTMQTRAADETETKFFKCTKCAHTWRDYN